jgi:hypothetical protein
MYDVDYLARLNYEKQALRDGHFDLVWDGILDHVIIIVPLFYLTINLRNYKAFKN